MRINFSIHYSTDPTEQVHVEMGGRLTPLTWSPGNWWRGEASTFRGAPYTYVVMRNGDEVAREAGPPRHTPAPGGNEVSVVDHWRNHDPAVAARRSALFRRALASHHPKPTHAPPDALTLRVQASSVLPGLRPAVLGSSPGLGGWEPERASVMTPAPFPWWQVSVPADAGAAYKYVLVDEAGSIVAWETGPNHEIPQGLDAPVVVVDDVFQGLPGWRGAGVAVPVFSLRTESSLGVGQFTDLIPLVDWAADSGFTVVQILPVNDTVKTHDWGDSYPYDVVSVRALHPMYIDLDELGIPSLTTEAAAARVELEGHPEVAYEQVMERKWSLLHTAYEQVEAGLEADKPFQAFVAREWDWLGPYAMWCVLRDLHVTPDPAAWGGDRRFDPQRLEAMRTAGTTGYHDLMFHCWVQHHLHRQLGAATAHARSRGVALKGDLPIGVSPTSVETWVHPELFHLGTQAGAPPDAFAVRGQNWGFPTYDWERMADDRYAWWRGRFRAMAEHVDVYRIDHVLGFFRIWEIPPHAVDGLLGRFRPCLPLRTPEIAAALGDVPIDRLLRPTVDVELLEARFDENAGLVQARCFAGADDDLVLSGGPTTQSQVVAALTGGAFGRLSETARSRIERGLLDIVADVMLMEVDGGYHPRISWEATETYRRMSAEQQAAFDALATDFFHRRHDELWEARGRTALAAVVDATDMLACGEDLGMVPDFVPGVMNELGLLSLEIERMPKSLGAWISDPGRAPYLSVVSPGTHDTSPLREWWQEDPEVTERYWHAALGRWGDPPEEATPEVIEAIIRRHLAGPAMLCIAPLTDLLAMDEDLTRSDGHTERVNDPADRHHRWRHRLHVTLEELAAAEDFTARLRTLLAETDR